MKREKQIRFYKIISIAICIIFVFYCYIPKRAWPISIMDFTVGENKVDVLCVGSSHVYLGINPIQMYEERGIAAYDIALGSQAPWQSYYYILEACKSQKPQIIIFDTYMVGSEQSENYYQDYMTVNNLANCPLSLNKISAVLASEAHSKIDILLNFPYSHDDEFDGFSLNKIVGDKDYSLGYIFKNDVEEYIETIDVSDVDEQSAVSYKNEKYLRLIIEYCLDNGISLILTNTPWPDITEKTQAYFNYISGVAKEYDVPFIDGCKLYKEMGIDYSTDCSGNGGHLNDSGVSKYTSWLADYIIDNYSVIDRRGDGEYSEFDKSVEWLKNKRDE